MTVLTNSDRGIKKVDSWIDSVLGFCQTCERKRQLGKRFEQIVKREVKMMVRLLS